MPTPPGKSEPINFRLSGEALIALQKRSKRSGKSAGIIAKQIVTDALLESEMPSEEVARHEDVQISENHEQVLAQFQSVLTEGHSLRSDLREVLKALLLNLTDINEDEVRQFVSAKLKPQ